MNTPFLYADIAFNALVEVIKPYENDSQTNGTFQKLTVLFDFDSVWSVLCQIPKHVTINILADEFQNTMSLKYNINYPKKDARRAALRVVNSIFNIAKIYNNTEKLYQMLVDLCKLENRITDYFTCITLAKIILQRGNKNIPLKLINQIIEDGCFYVLQALVESYGLQIRPSNLIISVISAYPKMKIYIWRQMHFPIDVASIEKYLKLLVVYNKHHVILSEIEEWMAGYYQELYYDAFTSNISGREYDALIAEQVC